LQSIFPYPSFFVPAKSVAPEFERESRKMKLKTMSNQNLLFTPLEVADICQISRRRVYDWISAGWLRSVRVGGRWVVSSDDLDTFRSACRGAEGRLMPQLWEWDEIWEERPLDNSREWIIPKKTRSRTNKKHARQRRSARRRCSVKAD
jgi:excisionase family DNA binding protein